MKKMLKILGDRARDGAEALEALLTNERTNNFECANNLEHNETEQRKQLKILKERTGESWQ